MGSYLDFTKLYLYCKTQNSFFLPKTPHPFRASIRLTEKCNSKCITCGYWKKPWEDKISTEKAIKIVKELKNLGVRRLRFTGGEPLLRQDFFEILNATKKLNFKKITLATNGLLLNKYREQINLSCLTHLSVSIDGLAETNDKIRGVNGGFDRVMASLKQIQNKNITIMSTLGSWIVDDLRGLLNLLADRQLLWDINLPDNKTYFLKEIDTNNFWPSHEQVNSIIQTIRNYKDKPILRRISEAQLAYMNKYLKKEKLHEPPCVLGFTDIGIDSAGNVYSGCYAMPPVGCVLEENIKSIINKEGYRRRLFTMLRRNCPGCNCGYELNLIIQSLPTRVFKALIGKGVK